MLPSRSSMMSASERVRTYTHDGLRFDVSDTGPMNGPIVVLLHGFPQRATCWRRVSRLLNDRGFRTLAPDQRGYSPGARPRSRHAYMLRHLVADIEALLEFSARPVQLVGHDWGAVVAWATAARHPGLLSSLVTISAPHPRAFSRALITSDQAVRSTYAVAFQLPFLPEALASTAPALLESGLRSSGMAEDAIWRFRCEVVEDGAFGPALGWYRGSTGRPRRTTCSDPGVNHPCVERPGRRIVPQGCRALRGLRRGALPPGSPAGDQSLGSRGSARTAGRAHNRAVPRRSRFLTPVTPPGHRSPLTAHRDRIRSSTPVPITVTRREPRQPSRLLKKKNIRAGTPRHRGQPAFVLRQVGRR
jgi:pimeloyl-ACP methyl ester carboxylesterase